MKVRVIDHPFNRHWYPDYIGKVFDFGKNPPYALFEFVDKGVQE